MQFQVTIPNILSIRARYVQIVGVCLLVRAENNGVVPEEMLH